MNPNEIHNNNNMNNDRISPFPLRMPPVLRETLEAIAKQMEGVLMPKLFKDLKTVFLSQRTRNNVLIHLKSMRC